MGVAMDMKTYLAEIAFAVDGLIPLIWSERMGLQELHARVAALEKIVETQYQRAEAIAEHAEDAEDTLLATGIHWDTYFGEDKDLHTKRRDMNSLKTAIATHDFSVSALAGTLLQYGKQGISIVHGRLAACPAGRPV